MRPILAAVAALALLGASSEARADDGGTVGARVFVDPLSADLRIRPSKVQVGQAANARSTIVNRGPAPLGAVTVTLLIDAQGVVVAGGTTRIVAGIAPHSSVELIWRVCGARPGSYLAMVDVSSSDAFGRTFETETTAALLEVKAGPGRPGSC